MPSGIGSSAKPGMERRIARGLDQHKRKEEQHAAERAVEQEGEQGEPGKGARAEHRDRHHRAGAAVMLDPQEQPVASSPTARPIATVAPKA
jgi:hypothetical protein